MVERHGIGSSKPFHCLLVPTDFSSGADLALCRAARLPLAPKAKVLLVHVLPPGHTVRLRAQAEADARQRRAKAAALVADTASESGPSSVTVESEILSGSSFVEIIRRSRTASAGLIVLDRHGHRPIRDMFIGSTAERVVRKGDLVVLGTHGRSGMSHVLLGSVAEWVIRTARCDVLVSRPVRFSFRSP